MSSNAFHLQVQSSLKFEYMYFLHNLFFIMQRQILIYELQGIFFICLSFKRKEMSYVYDSF